MVIERLRVPPLFRQLQRVLDASCSEPAADAAALVGHFYLIVVDVSFFFARCALWG